MITSNIIKQIINVILPLGLSNGFLNRREALVLTALNKQSYYSRARSQLITKDEIKNISSPWTSDMWQLWHRLSFTDRVILWRDTERLTWEIRAFIWYTNPHQLKKFITKSNNEIIEKCNYELYVDFCNKRPMETMTYFHFSKNVYTKSDYFNHINLEQYTTNLKQRMLPDLEDNGTYIWPHLHSAQARLKWLKCYSYSQQWHHLYNNNVLIALENVERVDDALGGIWTNLTIKEKRLWLHPILDTKNDFVVFWQRLPDSVIDQIPPPPPYTQSRPMTIKWPVAKIIRQYLRNRPSTNNIYENMLVETVAGLNHAVQSYWLHNISKSTWD